MKRNTTQVKALLLLITILILVSGCSDEAPIIKVGETVVEEVHEHRQKNWNYEIKVTMANGYEATYHCNKYNKLTSSFDGGVLLRLSDCAPTGVGYDFSWLVDHVGPTFEVK